MSKLFLTLSILGALFFRFWNLSSSPPGIFQDEAAMGYNAYSILKTGRDEYGQILPLAFRSFADYKLPLYVYLSVVPVKIFGLNEFSTRFTSAISGVLSSLIIYLIVRQLFGRPKLAILSALVFAWSPWSIFASRSAYESNLGLLLLLTAFYLQLRNKPYLAALFYALTTYAYIPEKFLAPLFLFLTAFIFKKPKIIKTLALFLLFSLPQYYLLGFAAGSNRISNLSPTNSLYLLTARYVSYFSPRNLFFDPNPDPGYSFVNLSTFFPWMVIPFLIGIFLLISKQPKYKIIICWLLLSPIPAAITRDPFATIRALPLIFPICIIISLGLEKILYLGPLFLFISALSLWTNIFVLLPHERVIPWRYGFKQLITKLESYPNKKVLFDDPRGVYYIEFLFFEKYSPQKFQQEQHPLGISNYYNNLSYDGSYIFANLKIRPLDWTKDSLIDQIIVATPLAINDAQAKEHFLKKEFDIFYPNKEVAFQVFSTQPQLKLLQNKIILSPK